MARASAGSWACSNESGDVKLEVGVFGGVSGGGAEFGLRARIVFLADEIAGQLKTDLAAADVAVSLPCSVECPLVVFLGVVGFAIAGGEARELEMDEAIAGLSFEQRIEVGGGLERTIVGGEGRGETQFQCRGVRVRSQARSAGPDRVGRLAVAHGALSVGLPALGQNVAMMRERGEEEVSEDGENGGDDKDGRTRATVSRRMSFRFSARSSGDNGVRSSKTAIAITLSSRMRKSK